MEMWGVSGEEAVLCTMVLEDEDFVGDASFEEQGTFSIAE